jgi:hypothetical protein
LCTEIAFSFLLDDFDILGYFVRTPSIAVDEETD